VSGDRRWPTWILGAATVLAVAGAGAILLFLRTPEVSVEVAPPPSDAPPPPVLYQEKQPFSVPLEEPRALALAPDGAVAVGGEALVLLDAGSGKPIDRMPLEKPATCLAVDADGTIYAGLVNAVAVFGADGAPAQTWMDLGERARLTSVTIRGEEVVLADSGSRRVWRFSKEGRLLGHFDGKSAESRAGFIVPSPYFDAAVDPEGGLWVVNPGRQRVERHGADGSIEKHWGEAGWEASSFCGCCNPTHLAVAPDGAFITSEKGIARVKRYNGAGTFEGLVAGPEAFDEGTAGLDLAVDGEGTVYLLDPHRLQVRRFIERTDGGTSRGKP